MIEVGTLLFFAPPRYASGQLNTEYKKRIMLVIEIDNNTNLMTLINISSLKGKPRWFTYKDELSNIIKRRKDYMKSNNIEQVIFSSEEIIEFNK